MHEEIAVNAKAMEANDLVAAQNRAVFASRGLRSVNLIGSPGSGKTSLLEAMGKKMGKKLAVVTGDLRTTLDADRISASGALAVQIETGDTCHLTARMVSGSLQSLPLDGVEIMVIENVGNLVCPAAYDLGEDAKIAVLSTAEGDEKPVKYPSLFLRADAVVFTKVDLLPHLTFNMERAKTDCRQLHSHVKLLETSVRTGAGIDALIAWIRALTPGKPLHDSHHGQHHHHGTEGHTH